VRETRKRKKPIGGVSHSETNPLCLPSTIKACHTGLPNKGTASDVAGIVSATMFRNTVRERRIVTPARRNMKLKGHALKVKWWFMYGWRGGEATLRHQECL
jgi:hypothetical protein